VSRRPVAVFLLSLLYASVCSAQSKEPAHERPSGVRGTIVDRFDHTPVRDPYVVVHADGSETVQIGRGSKDGTYSIKLLPAIYDVCVMASSFSPTCRKIEVAPDGMMVFNAELEANSVGMQPD
jgi:hypothetical protein